MSRKRKKLASVMNARFKKSAFRHRCIPEVIESGDDYGRRSVADRIDKFNGYDVRPRKDSSERINLQNREIGPSRSRKKSRKGSMVSHPHKQTIKFRESIKQRHLRNRDDVTPSPSKSSSVKSNLPLRKVSRHEYEADLEYLPRGWG